MIKVNSVITYHTDCEWCGDRLAVINVTNTGRELKGRIRDNICKPCAVSYLEKLVAEASTELTYIKSNEAI